MDSSFGYGHAYQPRSARTIDGLSQVSHSPAYNIKQVQIPCPYHAEQQSMNYCTEPKCHQPLCSECIEDHLLYHKKNGLSDLGIKSLRGTRKDCAVKLGGLIDQLLRKLGQLDAPPAPEQQLQSLQNKLEAVRTEIHEMVQLQFARIRDSLRVKIAQSANMFKAMSQIHAKLEGIIEQLRETHATLIDGGKKGGIAIPDCIRKTLTLDVEALLQTFQQQGAVYDSRRKNAEFDVFFQSDMVVRALAEAVKVITPQSLNTSTVSYSNRQNTRIRPNPVQEELPDSILPQTAKPQGKISFLHFFETGSNRLHLIYLQNRRKGVKKVVAINEFVVPSFHASIISHSGQYIFLSGGIVELNGGGKSPMFVRYSVRNQSAKKDFARVRPRSSHSLCQDSGGNVYILGGYGPPQFSGGDPSYQTAVERVNQRSGTLQMETESTWGGSNISMLCRNHILKACDEGVELYNPKIKQWIIADLISRSKSDFIFFKSAGYANLSEGQVLIFGGYSSQTDSSDICWDWKVTVEGKSARISVAKLGCRLPIPEGFENCSAVVDDEGIFALQNIEDSEQFCVDNQKRLLRFDLKNGSGEWKALPVDQQDQ